MAQAKLPVFQEGIGNDFLEIHDRVGGTLDSAVQKRYGANDLPRLLTDGSHALEVKIYFTDLQLSGINETCQRHFGTSKVSNVFTSASSAPCQRKIEELRQSGKAFVQAINETTGSVYLWHSN